MKTIFRHLLATLFTLVLLTAAAAPALAGSGMGTAFTYRGTLSQAGAPYSGQCDFQFGLWNAGSAGIQIGPTQDIPNVTVIGGVFEVSLDFGAGAFDGAGRWLVTAVRCPAGAGSYVTLSPRQALTPMPYALYALRVDAANVSGLSAGPGLTYTGGQFSVNAGAISNSMLANPALTVVAGTGLSGGGSVSLGANTTVSVAPGGITSTMLATGAVGAAQLQPGAVTAAKIDLSGVQARVTGTCSAGQSVQSINANGSVTCAGSAIPTGMIAAFAATSCPSGWSVMTEAQGRVIVGLLPGGTLSGTVGAALGNVTTRTVGLSVAQLPPHTHNVDPAAVVATTSTDGSHVHGLGPSNSGGASDIANFDTINRYSNGALGGYTMAAGAHSHTVTVDIPNTTSTATGSGAAVDVTMPYLQLLMCRKD